MQRTKQFCSELTAGCLACAEKELAAYAQAVQELFGSDYARQSIHDWVEEIEWMDWPSGDAIPDWRRLTVAATAKLATRVNVATSNGRADGAKRLTGQSETVETRGIRTNKGDDLCSEIDG